MIKIGKMIGRALGLPDQLKNDRFGIGLRFSDTVKPELIRHNIDDFFIEELPNGYTKFSYHGKSYVYGFVQSKIIKQLYDAAKDGRIWIYGKTLLKNAGSASYRLGDVFRPHKEWMELIKSNKQGLYRLYLE